MPGSSQQAEDLEKRKRERERGTRRRRRRKGRKVKRRGRWGDGGVGGGGGGTAPAVAELSRDGSTTRQPARATLPSPGPPPFLPISQNTSL